MRVTSVILRPVSHSGPILGEISSPGAFTAMPALSVRNRQSKWIWLQNLPFAGPTLLTLESGITVAPRRGGLYAIMVLDPTWRPLPYRVIYIGKAGNLAERVSRTHEKYPSWLYAASGAQLFVAFHTISGESARRTAERRLIEHYGPECNETFNHNAAAMRVLGLLCSNEFNWPYGNT